MKEHPILFNGPMVRATLTGIKTQTRRLVKPHRKDGGDIVLIPDGFTGQPSPVLCKPNGEPWDPIMCPFGQPGDRLWVRECAYYDRGDGKMPKTKPSGFDPSDLYFRADGECCEQIPECCCAEIGKPRWTPSIHMPRWASRITLEITAVRVERLKNLSEADARAEGMTSREITTRWGRDVGWQADWSSVGRPSKFALNGITTESDICLASARLAFCNLWESINGPCSWDANPWVWVVEFKRVEVPHA